MGRSATDEFMGAMNVPRDNRSVPDDGRKVMQGVLILCVHVVRYNAWGPAPHEARS
jgi:hypothetical protein